MIFILLVIITILLNVEKDFRTIQLGFSIDHWKETFIEAVEIILIVTMCLLVDLPVWPYVVAVPALRLLLYDVVLNLLRKLPVAYVGKGAATDRLQSWIFLRTGLDPFEQKIIFLILSIILTTLLL